MALLDRNTIRQKTLRARDLLSSEARREKSRAITSRLWQLEEFRAARLLFVYVNFRSETETLPLIRECLNNNMRIAAPLTLVKEKKLIPYEIHEPEKDLAPGYCQIPEPVIARTMQVDPVQIDTIILPGSVFDLCGGRLGYGGGYYDRFLASDAPQALRIAIAYDLQVIDALPLEPHDKRIHLLVTESRTLHFVDGCAS